MESSNNNNLEVLRQFNRNIIDELNNLLDKALTTQSSNSLHSDTFESDVIDLTFDYEEERCVNNEPDVQDVTLNSQDDLLDQNNNGIESIKSVRAENSNLVRETTLTIEKDISVALDNTEKAQKDQTISLYSYIKGMRNINLNSQNHNGNNIMLKDCSVILNRLPNMTNVQINKKLCSKISKSCSGIRKRSSHAKKSTDISNNKKKYSVICKQFVKKNKFKLRECVVILNRLLPDGTLKNVHNNKNKQTIKKINFQPRPCTVLLEKSSIIEAGNRYMQQTNDCMQIFKKNNLFKDCNVAFKKLSSNTIELNMRISINEKLYTCNKCQYHTLYRGRLTVHKNSHVGEKPLNNKIVKFPVRHVPEHLKMITDKRPFQCNMCKRCFTQRSHMNEHIKHHFEEKTCICPFCNCCFFHQYRLRKHIETNHTVVRNCQICGYCTVHLHLFLQHKKIHNKKPYTCKHCKYCSVKESNLLQHEKSKHSGNLPNK